MSDAEAVRGRCLLVVNVYLFYEALGEGEWRVGRQGEYDPSLGAAGGQG